MAFVFKVMRPPTPLLVVVVVAVVVVAFFTYQLLAYTAQTPVSNVVLASRNGFGGPYTRYRPAAVSEVAMPASDGLVVIHEDPFPPSFDANVYRRSLSHAGIDGPDMSRGVQALEEHYDAQGVHLGLVASQGAIDFRTVLRKKIIPALAFPVLEMGPFLDPIGYGLPSGKVKFFDIYDLPGLREAGVRLNHVSRHEVEIDFVSPTGDLRVIPSTEQFAMAISAHVVEHQLSLINHLRGVSRLLCSGGYYVLFVPDKRYCFDHYNPESTLADVLQDHDEDAQARGHHSLRTIVLQNALTTRNDADLWWRDGQKTTFRSAGPARDMGHDVDMMVKGVSQARDIYEKGKASGTYVDAHNYRWTPSNLAFTIDVLHGLQLIDFRVHRVYETIAGKFEFGLVLRKTSTNSKIN